LVDVYYYTKFIYYNADKKSNAAKRSNTKLKRHK